MITDSSLHKSDWKLLLLRTESEWKRYCFQLNPNFTGGLLGAGQTIYKRPTPKNWANVRTVQNGGPMRRLRKAERHKRNDVRLTAIFLGNGRLQPNPRRLVSLKDEIIGC
ncbi:hypothetical protein E2986_11516 [Frieseomelitta varia]|uniref:Uncharacterized protein n=1 Tax=Frieseomelitta varia TaxID=561572 RepID=A0A833W2J5_9HYME|nr:hypothetical protein E2986_11516 [Frieseomelitta varia]